MRFPYTLLTAAERRPNSSCRSLTPRRGPRPGRFPAGWLASLALLLHSALAPAAETGVPDLSAWQRMPVFHNGRMMPLNTFARLVVESVCDRANPRLDLDGVTEVVRKLPEFSQTEKLFPEPIRKFTASELLFSWMVEPERWEHVPFLIAEHETLRRELFKLPVVSAAGRHLKYVSPYDVEQSQAFQQALRDLADRQRGESGGKLRLTSLEAAVEQLYQAYMTYRSVAYDPFHDEPRAFNAALGAMATRWNGVANAWNQSQDALAIVAPEIYDRQFPEQIEAIRTAIAEAGKAMEQDKPDLRKAEKTLSETAVLADQLAERGDKGVKEVFARPQPPAIDEAQWRQIRNSSHTIASGAADLVLALKQAQLALFDSQKALRLLPGLNPAALETNRDAEDDAQPWLSLQTLLFSGDDVYRTFIRPELPPSDSAPLSPAGGMTRLELLRRLAAEGNPARPERAAFAEAAAAYVNLAA
ncbi:MAG: hypothetical protein ACYC6Y_25980, partial [Thermoguttaceae bacterium]